MSEELKNITESVMNQIHHGKVKMKPKIYFILGSVLTFLGLVSSVIISTFLVGLIRFSYRTHGPMGQYRFDQMLSNFPWWTTIFAVISLVVGIWLIQKYDFSYKKEPWVIILGFILAIIIAGGVIDTIGINDRLRQHGPMKGMMNRYLQDDSYQRGPGWKR